MYSEQINLSNLKTILTNIISNPSIKLLGSLIAVFYQWLFGMHTEAIIILLMLVSIDTITGMMRAIKFDGGLSSRGFFRLCFKFTVYTMLIANSSLIDKALPVTFVASSMFSFLSITEGISVMENLGKMGYPIPLRLLRTLQVMSDEKLMKKDKNKNEKKDKGE